MMTEKKPAVPPDIIAILTEVYRVLSREGTRAYLVGGLVRDTLLERETADIDLAVTADALEVAPRIAARLGGRFVELDAENGVARVILRDKSAPRGSLEIDINTIKDGIEADLARRDFTVNAMAVELTEPFAFSPIIDPFHGRQDLERGLLRTVSEVSFRSDPIRLLRAARLAAELGFRIEDNTEALVRGDCPLLTAAAGERVREELLRILAVPHTERLLAYLNSLGLLTAVVPELETGKGVSQPKIHYWDVFTHSLQCVAATDFLLRQGSWEYAGTKVLDAVPWSAELQQHFAGEISHGSTRRTLLKVAALLHDIAKPQTKTLDADGRARFLGHPQQGGAMAAGIMERLRFSTKEIKRLEVMVQNHLRPQQMSNYGLPTARAVYRYFRDTGDAGIDILFLSLADHLATRGPDLDFDQWQEHCRLVGYVLEQRLQQESAVKQPRIIDGHVLMNTLGLPPGPLLGRLLEAAAEAQAAGEITNREEALSYVKRLLAEPDRLTEKPPQEQNEQK